MAQQKLPLKDILAAIDMGAKTVWDEFTDDERKQISFWLLNRYVSTFCGIVSWRYTVYAVVYI